MISKERLAAHLEAVRRESPLVHNITNYVAMNNSANALLAIGASPVMAHWKAEMEEMTSIASALVLNIGTLDAEWIEGMLAAGKAARQRGVPIVLDPVGAGATSWRTRTAWDIIEQCKPTIIRGNGSEIMALVNADVRSKGVDSTASSDDALEAAQVLAQRTGAVVVISGPTDYITDGIRTETIANGAPIMTAVTGMGCTASAVVGAFVATGEDALESAAHAMAVMGVAGQRAAAVAKGSGSMQVAFLDELYNLTGEVLIGEVKQ
ncbi:MAG: hydroxyethylthiazole kinase [Tidjanibacter sp.]|nr:hydroxyethylthiazole kinase [Tidjanibacter sp.]